MKTGPHSGIPFSGSPCYKIDMVLRLKKFGRSGAALWVGLALGCTAGCASDNSAGRPADGLLDEAVLGGTPADEALPPTGTDAASPQRPDAKTVPPEEQAPAVETDGTAAAEHVLQTGDEIDIQVYREPELSGAFKISPAGEIRHSLAGAIPLAGKTVAEAETVFTRILAKDYLVHPRVIIKLLSTQSAQIVLMGEVKKPGVYPLPFGETLTLLQAIAGAGGFTELASPDRVRIVRRRPDGGQTTLRVRVSDLLKSRDGQNDVPLRPNDVIMVDQVFF